MSTTHLAFALCVDCWDLGYAPLDSNGQMDPNAGSWQHLGHAVHVFGKPADYPPPIRTVLTHLHASLPISDARLEMFSLAVACHGVQPNTGVKPDSPAARASASYVPGGLVEKPHRPQRPPTAAAPIADVLDLDLVGSGGTT